MSQLLLIGSATAEVLGKRLRWAQWAAASGAAIPPGDRHVSGCLPSERVALEYRTGSELAHKAARALEALGRDQPAAWRALAAHGICRGRGAPGKTAFLFPGEGSQYVNMLRELAAEEPVVQATLGEADRFGVQRLGAPLTELFWADPERPEQLEQARQRLTETAVVQCAAVAVNVALCRLLQSRGFQPDLLLGHSLGEYSALVASGSLTLAEALQVLWMASRAPLAADAGRLAVAFASAARVDPVLRQVGDSVALANLNSPKQVVFGGQRGAVDRAVERLAGEGVEAFVLPVTKAFHTPLVAPMGDVLRQALGKTRLRAPRLPVVSNVTASPYPCGGNNAALRIRELLARQASAPVRFSEGLEALYVAGARVFVEVGPKKALTGFAEDTLDARSDTIAVFTNHPKLGDRVALNRALGALYAAGVQRHTHRALQLTATRESTALAVAVGG